MAALNVPPEGLRLRNDRPASQGAQVIRLDLVEKLTHDLVRCLKNNEPVRLRCGKRLAVQYGKKTALLESRTDDTFPSEFFTRPTAADGRTLYFTGKSSHRLEVQKAEEDTAKSDEALATLESTLRSIQEQRASNETTFQDGRDDGKHAPHKDHKPSPLLQNAAVKKDHLLAGFPRSSPGSPFLTASFSPRLGPTSAPLASAVSTKERIRQDAMRLPVVHLLAARPSTAKELATQIRAPLDDCEKILEKVARDAHKGDGFKELKEKSYRELDVWKFPYRSPKDRQAAIDRAIQAYDRMRVEKKDPLWQLLLPRDERGKGKTLSRLNFDRPALGSNTPRPDRPRDDANESKADVSDREAAKMRPKKDAGVAPAKVKPKTVPTATAKNATDAQSPEKVAKQPGKFKSSERIEDSDEEAEAADVVVTPKAVRTESASKLAPTSAPPDHARPNKPAHVIASPKNPVHKSSLSNSSSGSNSSGSERPRHLATTNAATSSRSHQKPESAKVHASPRPRNDSSPQKPSPLGSSPPTTSTDLDNSGSSKASNQSSAPSSPPSSTDLPKSKHGTKYSPVISDRSRNVSRGGSPDRSAAKRKAGPPEEERPAKRPHTQPTHLAPLANGTAEPGKRPGPIRSESERSSSPEKPGLNRADVIKDARRFQKYYKRYKDLYDRILKLDERERDDKDMGDLWKMHNRLKEMKADIWDNWDKVERVEQVDKAREMVAV